MRWFGLLVCAIWATACSQEIAGPETHRSGTITDSSANEAATKKDAPRATDDEASPETAPVVEAAQGEPEMPAADLGAPRLIEHIVKPADVDPSVKQALEPHYIYLDTRAKTQEELVLYLVGANVKPVKSAPMLQEIASYGFHVVGLRYMNDFIVQTICNAHPNDGDCQGKLRREVIEGTDLSPYVDVPIQDGIDTRFAKALAYLNEQAPAEGWGKYLAADGTPDWTKIKVVGHSSGASTAGRMSKLRELGGVFMLSGPNDNLNDVPSKWMSEPVRTPVQRIWAFSDTDDAQYPQHKKGWTAMGLLGPATSIDGKTAPFDNAHRLTTSKPGGGHNSTNTGNGNYTAVWRYGLGL